MWVLVVALVVVVAVVVAGLVLRRPEGGDLTSVRRYHSALGTMEQVAERSGSAPVRIVGAGNRSAAPYDGAGDGPARLDGDPFDPFDASEFSDPSGPAVRTGRSGSGPQSSPAPVRIGVPLPAPGSPLVFDDHHPPEVPVPRGRTDRNQRHALASMNRRPRRGTAIAVVVVVVIVVLSLILIGSHRSDAGHGHVAANPPATTAPTTSHVTSNTSKSRSTSTTSATAGRGKGGQGKGGHAKGRSDKTKTTPTTLPTQIVASSTGPGVATFPVASPAFSVTITATGPCWVLVRSAATGSTLWTGTLQNGGVQTVPAAGTTTVELGSQAGSLKVGTVPVTLPSPLATPFVATFQPVTAGQTVTTSPTTTVG